MESLQGVDFENVAAVLDAHAALMRLLVLYEGGLRVLRLVERSVATTDAARVTMRRKVVGLHNFFGAPVVFWTINPTDVRNPFTLRFATAATVQDYIPHLSCSLNS